MLPVYDIPVASPELGRPPITCNLYAFMLLLYQLVGPSTMPSTACIEDLNLNLPVKKAIILLLYHADIKVLKDALAHLGPYQTLASAKYIDPGGKNTVPSPATIQI